MSETNATYGFLTRDIEGVAAELGRALGIRFTSRNDTHLGRWYQSGVAAGENFDLLYNNGNFADNQWMEGGHKHYLTILYVNRTTRHDDVEAAVATCFPKHAALIRAEHFPDSAKLTVTPATEK